MVKNDRSELKSISDRLGKIEAVVRSIGDQLQSTHESVRENQTAILSIHEQQTDFLRSIREQLEKLNGNSQGKQDGSSSSSSRAIVRQQGLPPPSRSQTEEQQYRLVIEGLVGTEDENGGGYYFVVKGKPISIKVTIRKLDGTPVRDDDPLASVTVELVVLAEDFYDPNSVPRWSKKAFEERMESPKVKGMTVKNGIFALINGSVVHDQAKIIKNSGKNKVKLGVMIHERNTNVGETRVFEGVSNPFRVKEPPRHPKNAAKCVPGSTATEEQQTPGSSSQPTTNGTKRGRTVQSQNYGPNFEGSSLMEPDFNFPLGKLLGTGGDHDPSQNQMMGDVQNGNNQHITSLVSHILDQSLPPVLKNFQGNVEIYNKIRDLQSNLEGLHQQLIEQAYVSNIIQVLQPWQLYLTELSNHHAAIMQCDAGRQLANDLQRLQETLMKTIQQPTRGAQAMQQPGNSRCGGYSHSNEDNTYVAQILGTNSQGNNTTPASAQVIRLHVEQLLFGPIRVHNSVLKTPYNH